MHIIIYQKTIASKSMFSELLEKFRTLMMSSSQISQKTTLLNLIVLFINRTSPSTSRVRNMDII